MSKLIINEEIDGESLEFIQGILGDLQGSQWIKDAILAGLRHDPDVAHDGARLIFEAMARRVGETADEK